MPYGNCATVLLPGEIAVGVLMIPEVRTGVKENLSETFRDSFGPSSTAIDYRRSGPAGPAIMAPSAAATNMTRHFYKYTPPRPLEEIQTEIALLEKEIVGMMREVVG